MEMWIRAKYEQKRWAMKGPIPDPSTLGGDDDIDDVVPSTPKSNSSTSSSVRQSPAPQKQQIKPKQSEFANLDAFLGSPSSSPAVSHQTIAKPAIPVATQLQGADFFFDSAPSSTPPASSSSTPTTTTASPQQSQAQKHNDFKSSILSLYSSIPAATPPPQQQQQQYGGSFQNQMAGLNLGGNQSYGNQSYGQQFNTTTNNNINNNMWGSFATATPSQPQQIQQPQGSQFFTSNTNTPAKKTEKKE
jgi:stromal membrane-associated protein